MLKVVEVITLLGSMTLFCETNNISHNILNIHTEGGNIPWNIVSPT